ncbi:unnamed protein product [Ectocarpus sp. 13 AM-2016]
MLLPHSCHTSHSPHCFLSQRVLPRPTVGSLPNSVRNEVRPHCLGLPRGNRRAATCAGSYELRQPHIARHSAARGGHAALHRVRRQGRRDRVARHPADDVRAEHHHHHQRRLVPGGK